MARLQRDALGEVEQGGQGQDRGDGDGGFDADVALTTGELRGMLPDLIEALGGPLEKSAAP